MGPSKQEDSKRLLIESLSLELYYIRKELHNQVSTQFSDRGAPDETYVNAYQDSDHTRYPSPCTFSALSAFSFVEHHCDRIQDKFDQTLATACKTSHAH